MRNPETDSKQDVLPKIPEFHRVLVVGFENSIQSVMCELLAQKIFSDIGFGSTHMSFESVGLGAPNFPIHPNTVAALKEYEIIIDPDRQSRDFHAISFAEFDCFFCTDHAAEAFVKDYVKTARMTTPVFLLHVPGLSDDLNGKDQATFDTAAGKMSEVLTKLAQRYHTSRNGNPISD